MKAYLMYKHGDFIVGEPFPAHSVLLTKGLELDVLFQALSGGDDFLYSVMRKVCSQPLIEVQDIEYRQVIPRDCLYNPEIFEEFYKIVVNYLLMEKGKLHYGVLRRYPSVVFHQSISFIRFLLDNLCKVRGIAEKDLLHVTSPDIERLFVMIVQELNDEYLRAIEEHLRQMTFKKGVLLSARLGTGNRREAHVLRQPVAEDRNWFQCLSSRKPEHHTVRTAPRDENRFRILSDLQDGRLVLVTSAMAQSTAHLLNFSRALRVELGFYIACPNLAGVLNRRDMPQCSPIPIYERERHLVLDPLFDTCLALTSLDIVISNTLKTDGKNTFIIIGVNQGGESTLLRSIGLAQIMIQAGIFASVEYFSSGICRQISTHYKCEEDSHMVNGKPDEEPRCIRDVVSELKPDDLVLFNESSAVANSREGASTIRGVVTALAECYVKSFFATHTSELAYAFYQEYHQDTVYLCVERRDDGERTFRMTEGTPLDISYGEDLYREVFTPPAQPAERS